MNKLFVVPTLLLLGHAVAASATESVSRDTAVLSAVVQRSCEMTTRSSYGNVQVIPSKTDTIEVSSFPKSFNKSAMQSLLARNAIRHDLPPVKMCLRFEVVASAKIDSLFNPAAAPGWHGFHNAFPKAVGILSLSLPGYSTNGQVAVVQVSYACGPLCGSGEYWVLRKVDGNWVVVRRSAAWIS